MPRERLRGMENFFEPKSIAVAGVSTDPNKMGSIIFANMLANSRRGLLRAKVYALNPAHDHIGDEPCYPTISALPEVPELLVVAVPESITPSLMEKAARGGVKAAVMVTSGYAEVGKGDVEKRIGNVAARHGMRILGPNTIGLLDMRSGVDTLFLRPMKKLSDGSDIVSLLSPLEGGVAIVTQSGHLGETISEELAANGVGIRALVGTGNQLDVSVEDVIEYFSDDPHTEVVVVYIEGVHDGRGFMGVAAKAAKKKPVIVFKVGKTDVGAKAALTHTASLVGDYRVYQAAFRQAGLVEAKTIQELVDDAISLSMFPTVRGRRLAIITNAGGVGAIAADEAQRLGLQVAPLARESEQKLRDAFAGSGFIENASLGNPIDLTASVTSDELVRATELVSAFEEYDLVVVLPTHQAPAIAPDIGDRLLKAVSRSKKPVCMCVIGETEFSRQLHRGFLAGGIPSFPTPERAVQALAVLIDSTNLRREAGAPKLLRRRRPLQFSKRSGGLSDSDVGKLLASYGIQRPDAVVVRSQKDLGTELGLRFPVACKLLSESFPHKKDVGGVVTGVNNLEEVKSCMTRFRRVAEVKGAKFDGMLVQEMVEGGVEVILGGTRDRTFGPVVLLGLGGTYTELFRDFAIAVAPVATREAKKMIAQTRLGRILEGYRSGPKVSIDRLAKVVSDFSKILVENPRIEEVEVNPLTATSREILAVDARAVLSG